MDLWAPLLMEGVCTESAQCLGDAGQPDFREVHYFCEILQVSKKGKIFDQNFF